MATQKTARKSTAYILAVCAAIALVIGGVFGAASPEAAFAINGNTPQAKWETFKAAVEKGESIVLDEDLVAFSQVNVSKNATVSGNGTIYRQSGNVNFPVFNVTGGTLTLGSDVVLSGRNDAKQGVAYTASDFASGTTDAPRGFFAQVEKGGTLNINGATLRDFYTAQDKDTTPKHVAPVVVNGALKMSGGAITNNVVGYVADDSKSASDGNSVKMYVKGAAPNSPRIGESYDRRRRAAGVDNGDPGSGITGTAGAIIFANGAKAEISGGSIDNNRGDTGGIMATDSGTEVTLNGSISIARNVGFGFGGGSTVEDGGAIYMHGGSMTENIAWFGGGAVCATQNGIDWLLGRGTGEENRVDGKFTLVNGSLNNNTALTRGGAILVDSNGVSLLGGELAGNAARVIGGAIYGMGDWSHYSYNLYLEEANIFHNTAIRRDDTGAEGMGGNITDAVAPKTSVDDADALWGGTYSGHTDDRTDFWPNDGTGGGVWLCPYGSTILDLGEANHVYIYDNVAKGATPATAWSRNLVGGQDLHSDSGTGGALIMMPEGETEWLDENSDMEHYVAVGANSNIVNLTSPLTGKGAPATNGVQIYNNVSRRGGGIGSDGSLIFGNPTEMATVESRMNVSKSWSEGAEQRPIRVEITAKDAEGNTAVIATVELDGTANGADTDEVWESQPEGNIWKGGFRLPLVAMGSNGKAVKVFELIDPDTKEAIDLGTKAGSDRLAKLIKDNRSNEVVLNTKGTTLSFKELVKDGSGKFVESDDYFFAPGEVALAAPPVTGIKPYNRIHEDGTVEKLFDVTFSEIVLAAPMTNSTFPEKEVNGQKDLVELAQRSDTFTYTIKQSVPGGVSKVVFEDELESVLEVVGEPTFSLDGAKIEVKGNKVTATVEGKPVVETATDMTLTIKAKIRDSVTDQYLIDNYGSTHIPNKATVSINDAPKVTNEVLVTPGDVPFNPVPGKHPSTMVLKAKKTLAGGNINSATYKNAFEFTITGSNGAPMPAKTTVTNNGENISFGTVTFDKAGTFTYTITESKPSVAGVVHDKTPKTVTVTVVEKKLGFDTYYVVSNVTSSAAVETNISYAGDTQLPQAPASVTGHTSTSNAGGNSASVFTIKNGGDTHLAYCLDFSNNRPYGNSYSLISNPADVQSKADLLKKIAYFGYPYDGSGELAAYVSQQNSSSTGLSNEKMFQYATNVAIWKTIGGNALPGATDSFSRAVHSIANKIIGVANEKTIPDNVQVALHVYSPGNSYNRYQRLISFDVVQSPQAVSVNVTESFANYIPKIATVARDSETEDHIALADNKATINDTVAYEGLLAGKTYTMKGQLVKKSDQSVLAEATAKFVAAEGGKGTVQLAFTVDARELAGEAAVAFETCYDGDEAVATHADINDAAQTVIFPEVTTNASDKADGDKIVEAGTDATVVDTVTYKNLAVGKEYTVSGKLVRQDGASIVVATAEKTFKAEEANGTVELEFTFNTTALAGKSVVAFETVTCNNKVVAVHEDINDEAQTVTVTNPTITVDGVKTWDDVNDQDGKRPKSITIRLLANGVEKESKTVTAADEWKWAFTDLLKYMDGNAVAYTITEDVVTDYSTTVTGYDVKNSYTPSKTSVDVVKVWNDVDNQDGKRPESITVKLLANGADTGKTVELNDSNEWHASFTDLDEKAAGKAIDYTIEEVEVSGYEVVVSGDAKKGFTITNSYTPETIDINVNKVWAGDTSNTPDSVFVVLVADDVEKEVVELSAANKWSHTWSELPKCASGQEIAYSVYEKDVEGYLASSNSSVSEDGSVHSFTFTNTKPQIATVASDASDGDKYLAPEAQVTVKDVVTYTDLVAGNTYTMSGKLVKKSDQSFLAKASAEFTAAEGGSGTVELTFTVDASKLVGEAAVAFETCYEGDVELASHADINDEDQTVYVPEIATVARDSETNDHIAMADDSVTVNDTVAYAGLVAGKTYTMKGQLVKKSDQSVLAEASSEFVAAEGGKGTIELAFTVDAAALAGQAAVAFETCYEGDAEVAAHADINDAAQTIVLPDVNTNATDKADGDKIVEAGGDATVVDEVMYTNLIPGKEYTVSGKLVRKDDANVAVAYASKTFTAEEANGSVEIEFTFNTKALAGQSVVAFQTITYNGKVVAVHEDINDAAQTVAITNPTVDVNGVKTWKDEGDQDGVRPKSITIRLLADGSEIDSKTVTAADEWKWAFTGLPKFANGNDIAYTITEDAVNEYSTVIDGYDVINTHAPGKTSVTVTKTWTDADNKDTKRPESITVKLLADGQEANSVELSDENNWTHTFTDLPINKSVGVPIAYTVEEVGVAGYITVVSGDATKGFIIANSRPRIATVASDAADGDKYLASEGTVEVKDVVVYEGLIPGKTYTMSGQLVKKSDLTVVAVASAEFEAGEEGKGEVELTFSADAAKLAGDAAVAFEACYEGDVELAVHADINDEDQTVYIPEIATVARDSETNDHMALADEEATIIDTVVYEGLIPGKTYTMAGQLINKSSKSVLTEAAAEFVAAEGGKGEVELKFSVNASELAGQSAVAFETCFDGDVVVAVHADLKDKDQTVDFPEANTNATNKEDGGKVVPANSDVTVVDEVAYTNLALGEEYTLSGKLVRKDNADIVVATAERTFVADKVDGSVDLDFTFNTAALAGQSVVAFQTISYNGKVVAVHEDINDEAQTVTVADPKIPTVTTEAKAGDGTNVIQAAEGQIVVDVVVLEDLTVGTEYTVTGKLMLKDGTENGTELGSYTCQPITFIAESDSETMEMTFTDVDASGLDDEQALVVFETLTWAKASLGSTAGGSADSGAAGDEGDEGAEGDEGTEGASKPETESVAHEDINDDAQTVLVERPTAEPVKKVDGQFGPVELENRDDVFTYTVDQVIPRKAINVVFTDTLVDELAVVEASFSVDGIEPVVDGQTVTATIEDASKLAGETVRMTIEAKIRPTVTDAQLISAYGDERKVPNKATVTIDSNPKVTNEVLVIPPEEPIETPDKWINGHKVPVLLLDRAEEFTYTVTQKMPSAVKTATFTDTLEDVLQIEGTPTVDGKASYDVKVDGQTVTATAADASADAGEVVTLTIKARIKDGISDEEIARLYGKAMLIPNVATVTVNDKPQTTNEVQVTPPAKEPEKEVNGQKEALTLSNRDQVFTYTITQVIPSGVANVLFTDTLVDELEVKETSFTIDGVAAVGQGAKVEGQVVTAEIANATQMAGQTAVLTIKAAVRADVTDAQLIEAYGEERQIPNEATVSLNNDPKVTNKVLVTPPDEEGEDPIKKINGDTKLVELKTRPEYFTYSVTQLVPATATKVVFSDTLEDVLEFTGTEEAIDASINASNAVISINGQTITATLEGDAAKDVRGQEITLVFKAKIKEGVTDEQLIAAYGTADDPDNRDIPNKASVKIDDKPAVDTNTVYVVPPTEPGEDPVKLINDQKELVKLENRTSEFVYKVQQKIPATATKASFTDTLEDVLEVTKAEMQDAKATYEVAVNGKTVTATTDDVRADRNQVVTLVIWAKIADGITDLDLVEKYGDSKKVPNKATVSIDDDPKTTNEVLVTPPDDPTDEPEKFINGQQDQVRVSNRNEAFVYTVKQKVPATATAITFEDQLESVLEVIGTPTVDMNGAEVTVKDNKVVATAEGAAVKAVRGKTVTLTIAAKIRADVSELELVEAYGDEMVIPNEATVSINNKPKTTNKVEVCPPPEEGTDPVKQINDSFDPVMLEQRYDGFTYTVAQLVPATAKTVTFEDTLVDVLVVEDSTEAVVVDGAANYDISIQGNHVVATTADATADRGQVVTMTIRARIADGTTDADLIALYGDDKQIPNQATVTINDKPRTTNTVLVTPPDDPTENPVKKVNGQTGLVELANRTETFTYTVSQVMPANATSAAFEDELEDVLEIVKAEITGASDYEIKAVGQRVTATTADARPDRGQEVVLTIVAKLRDNVSDSELIRRYGDGCNVPNQATVSINDVSNVTNIVEVTPPPEPTEEPEKKVNGVDSIELTNRDQIFTYTVTQLVPAAATTVTFEDQLEDVLQVTNATITGAAGYDIAVDGQKVVATTADARADRGRVVTLTIQAKIRANVSDADLIERYGSLTVPNKAVVTIDGAPKTTNEVLVTPPTTVDEEPVKYVNGSSHADLATRNEVFTYTVNAVVPADATKFVLTDTLEPVLYFAEGTALVNAGGGQIAIDGQTITATFEGDAAIALRGKQVSLSFNAVIRDGADLSPYANDTVPNKASYIVNDDPGRQHETNTVTVTPPAPVDEDLQKFVNGVQHADLFPADEVFWYTLRMAVPSDATKVAISDTLVDELTFASSAEDVQVNVEGEGVTKTIEGQTLTVTIDDITEESGVRGAIVEVVFPAQIKAGADISKYTDNKVPNTGSYTINDDPNRTYESNVVTVTPKPVGNVDVLYITTDGQVLRDWEVVAKDALVGSTYKTFELAFDGYRFVTMGDDSDAPTGDVIEGWKHVIYVYEPVPEIIPDVYGYVDVVYVTTDGKILQGVDMVADKWLVGTEYTTEQLEFPKYTFVGMSDQSDEPSGQVIEGWKHVIYVYEPIPEPVGSVDVKYITTTGEVLRDTAWVVQDGTVGTTYTTTLNNFDGYRFVYMDPQSDPAAGLVVEGIQHVIYVYEPIPEVPTGSVDVTHVTIDGTVLKETAWVAQDEPVNTPYATQKETFEGYNFVKLHDDSAAAKGVVVEGIQHVIYVYEPVPDKTPVGSVDVTHVAIDGTVLKETVMVQENQPVNTPYITEQETFEGYTFVKMSDDSANPVGLVKEGIQHVIYVYEPIQLGSVDVIYITTDNQVLKELEVVADEQPINTPYTTDLLTFEGYTFVKMDESSAKPAGLVTAETQHVIYVYEPITVPSGSVDVVYVSTDGTVLKETEWVVQGGEIGSDYTTEQLPFEGYVFKEMGVASADPNGKVTEGVQHVIYVYEPLGSVDVTYVTSDGTVLKETVMVQENQPVNTPYTTEQLTFEGYTFTKMDDTSATPNGVVEKGTKHVIYVYDPIDEIEVDEKDPVDKPKTDEPEKIETDKPTTPETPTTTTEKTVTPNTPVQTTVVATPTAAPTPAASPSPVASLATKTLDEFGPMILALAAAAVLAFAAGVYALRRRHDQ